MKLVLLIAAHIFVSSSYALADSPAFYKARPITTSQEEKYRYEAIPQNGNGKVDEQKEIIEMKYILSDNRISLESKIKYPGGHEITRIYMEPDGAFISGTKEIVKYSERHVQRDKISRDQSDERKVYSERHRGEKRIIKEFIVPKGKTLAVDASLLVLLRSFPFDQSKERDIFMIDFSQYSISVAVSQSAVENIRVPAGEFECYRMEVVVKLFIFRPKIIYWITKAKPHFLVKHEGKKSPFSPSYITYLTSINSLAMPQR